MNYTYDIILNFNKDNLYEFYEWIDTDCPEYVLKIPTFKVDNETIKDLKINNVIVDKDFISKIYNKTEVYDSDSIKSIEYACLFVSDEEVIALEFDEDGNSYMKSLMCIDEENDILEFSKKFKYTIIDYKIKNKVSNIPIFNTRKELQIKYKIENKINDLYINKEYSKLKYILYELFKEKNDDEVSVYYKIINLIRKSDNKIYRIEELLSMMDKKIMN